MSKVICLWASPRNVSTALMYSFAQRQDVEVMDEPFYAFHLNKVNSKVSHPGKKEILKSQPNDLKDVLDLIAKKNRKKNIFIKNMTHHLKGQTLDFANNWINIILTRNPKNAINSFSKVINNPNQDDVGYQLQYKAALHFKNKGLPFRILDSDQLLANPAQVLYKLCAYCDIEFDKAMLKWPKNGIKEDGVWAKYWYENVHNSNGFKKPNKANHFELKKLLLPLLKECNYFYEELLKMEDKI